MKIPCTTILQDEGLASLRKGLKIEWFDTRAIMFKPYIKIYFCFWQPNSITNSSIDHRNLGYA